MNIMQYRTFPERTEQLSILGFGCMRLPKSGPAPEEIDYAVSISMVRKAIDAGVNYIDTAWPYHGGESERFLAAALEDGYRDKVNLATKLPSWLIKSREDMDHYLNEQLIKLNTDHIDYYLIHGLTEERWQNLTGLNIVDFIEKSLEDGRIRHIGFSFHDELPVFKKIIDAYPWEFCQIQYNLLDTAFQAGEEGLQYAWERKIGIIVMEPLRGGALTENVPPVVTETWNGTIPGRSPADWALRWVWNDPRVTVVLSGMSTPEQVEENISVASSSRSESMTSEEIETVEKVRSFYKDKIKVSCTACQYCMPCPSRVDIPGNFRHFNDLAMFENLPRQKALYTAFMSNSNADLCTECGSCEPLCPQNISIIEELKKVSSVFMSGDAL